MKVHGLDNTIPPSDNSRKIQKSIDQSSAIGTGAKIAGKNGLSKDSVSARSNAVEKISRGKDIIELKVNRATDSGNYSVERTSGAAGETYHISQKARIIKARQNIADGYYNSSEFIERLAEILIDKFYLSGEGE